MSKTANFEAFFEMLRAKRVPLLLLEVITGLWKKLPPVRGTSTKKFEHSENRGQF